jgi:CHAT domain-containing protein
LHLLPFTALQDQDGLYLTDKWHLITLYSPRDIVLTKKSNKTKTASAIFAAPDFGDINVQSKMAGLNTIHFSELPGTLIEGQQIKQLFTQKKSQSSVKLFLKKQATELKILNLTSPKILHIATHGFFLEDIVKDDKALERGLVKRSGLTVTPLFIQNPLARSGLAFSGANSGIIGNTRADNTDGILTALEALNLNLDGTDLVVLSACETGLGNIKIGEGVYSLNRSFQEAGAKMVLSTLWSVADEATGIFMTKFYDRFLDGKSAQKAIQETQNEFRHDKKYSHPFYWAGFVVTGK